MPSPGRSTRPARRSWTASSTCSCRGTGASRCPRAPTATTVSVPDPRGGKALSIDVLAAETNGYRLHLIDHPPAYDREGLYGDANGDYPDNAWRFGLLCRAALERLRMDERPPDVIHIHDWHTAPAVLLRDGLLASDPSIAPRGLRPDRPQPRVPRLDAGGARFPSSASGRARCPRAPTGSTS